MVRTNVDARARKTYSAGTLRHHRSRTLHVGRIAPHVEQPGVESIALYVVQPRFSITRETRGSYPAPSHRERQSYRRDDDVGP